MTLLLIDGRIATVRVNVCDRPENYEALQQEFKGEHRCSILWLLAHPRL